MSLTIIDGEADLATARDIFGQAGTTLVDAQGDADMGAYWVSRNNGVSHLLSTAGAGPCTIIIIRDADGGGALGHYAAHYKAEALLSGLAAMAASLGAPQVTDVLFTAGVLDEEDQGPFDSGIVAGAQAMFPAAQVRRITYLSKGGVAGAAVYFPRTGVVALFEELPRPLWGTGGDEGLKRGYYPEF